MIYLLYRARYAWLCCVISDTRHQYWGRYILIFLKCFSEVTCNSKASYRVSWMSHSSLKIYYGKEEAQTYLLSYFPVTSGWGGLGPFEIPMAVWMRKPFTWHMTPCHCVFLFGLLGRWRWKHNVPSKRRRLRSDAFTYRRRESPRKGFCLLERGRSLAVTTSPF